MQKKLLSFVLFFVLTVSCFAESTSSVTDLSDGTVVPMANLLVVASHSASFSIPSAGSAFTITGLLDSFDKNDEWDGTATFTSKIKQTVAVKLKAFATSQYAFSLAMGLLRPTYGYSGYKWETGPQLWTNFAAATLETIIILECETGTKFSIYGYTDTSGGGQQVYPQGIFMEIYRIK